MNKFKLTEELLVVAAAVVLLSSRHTIADEAEAVAGLPNCPTRCGTVTVPYPFGISTGCSLPGFGLTCDRTQSPPRLLLGGGGSNLEVVSILIREALIRVKYTTVNITWNDRVLQNSGHYLLSGEFNKFLVTERNAGTVTMLGNSSNIVSGSCSSSCHVKYNVTIQLWEPTDGAKHTSIGCRPSPANIPIARASYVVQLTWLYPNHGYSTEAQASPSERFIDSSRSERFIESSSWFNRNVTSLQSFHQRVIDDPVLFLNWAVGSTALALNGKLDGNATCPKDLGSTLCHSSYSTCQNTTDLIYPTKISACCPGYTCQCWDGYQGNAYLPDGCQGLSVVSAIGSGATLLILAVGTILFKHKIKMRRLERMRRRFFLENRGQLLQQLVSERADIAERMIMSLNELQQATNNFDEALRLGGGGHGTVYKGILLSLDVVAIKRSNIVIQKEIDEFINEVAILSQINHRNIVKLLGCCLETEVPLLVYEFISNGTLYDHLHVGDPISLSWTDRLRIAVEISRALAYLHSLVSRPIIHRDIKSTNILLDDNLTVKLSDFGASRYISVNQMGVNTVVQGTRGYLDPMYYTTGRLTDKSDVYSFGVILIELLTRKKPVSYRSSQGYGLVQHFDSLLSEGKLDYILDRQVIHEGGGEVTDVALLAAICVQLSAEDRPTMREVEVSLEAIQAAREPVSSTMTDDSFDWTTTWMNDMSNEGQPIIQITRQLCHSLTAEPLSPGCSRS
ncbi:unnamed protein product [Urochloa decumbens]|uniref:Protein kinase domain-containing protein n=1 Tax=Urochloa decumbens TaxID=240449 RepID=A0ABC9D8Q2_9POAL